MSDLGSFLSMAPRPAARPSSLRRALPFALLATLALAGCGTTDIEAPKQPPFYENLAKSGEPVNAEAAASIFSDYRVTKGLNPVTIDPALNKIAQDQADAMARADTLSHEVGGRTFVQRMNASGYKPKVAVENVGAGYHTLAEAFSGWRDSPPHNKNMLATGVTRMGIATAFNPRSKYKVYWALVLATPDDGGR